MGRAASSPWALGATWALGFACALATASRADSLQLTPEFKSAEEALDPVNWLLAQSPPAQRGATAPPPAPAPAAAADKSGEAQPASGLWSLFATESFGRLQLAPMRWRGNVGVEQRWVQSDEGGRRNQTIEFVNFDLATYISQPWIAQVRANLGVLAYQQRFSGDALALQGSAAADRSASLTGGATVIVFPASRFPFTGAFSSSDSRSSGEATTTDYVNRSLSLRQSYRSPLGDQVYTGSLERSTLISESFGRDTVTSLGGTMQRALGPTQTIDFNGQYAQNRRSQDGVGSDIGRLTGHHSWRPDDLMSVETFASYSLSDLTSPAFSGVRSQFMQLNSFGTWRPEEDSPLFMTGGVRLADASFGIAGSETVSRTLGANVAGSYSITDNARLVGSASVATLRGDGTSEVVTTQSLGANYSPPPIPLGPVSYSWGSSFSGTNQTGGVESAQHVVVAQANHQASTGKQLGGSFGLNGSVNQGFSVQQDSQRGASHTLAHSATLGARWNPTAASDGFASVSVGDSRTSGAREETFQLVNGQVTGQLQVGIYSLLSANLTVQGIRQDLVSEGEKRSTVQRSGTLSYQHGRLLNIPRLRLVLSATYNDVALESRLLGDTEAPRDVYNRLYEGRLQWDIGRLDFRLGMRIATFDGQRDRQVFFRVNRQFGIY